MKRFALLLLIFFPSIVAAQDLSLKGDGVKVVKVDKVIIVKEDATVIQSFPFTITAPDGAGLYFWTFPSTLQAIDKGNVLEVSGGAKGTITVSSKSIYPDVDKDGKFKGFVTKFASIAFTIGDVPAPVPPGPTPPVPPEPIPVPVAQKIRIVVIEETADATGARAAFFKDTALKARMDAKGHLLRVMDKDLIDETGTQPAWAKAYIDRAAGRLPFIILTDMQGKLLAEQPIAGMTPDAVIQLLAKWGG